MSQSEPITIQGWQKGVATSPYVGFGKMVGMDIFRKPGIIQVGTALNNTGYTITGFPTAEVIDSSGNIYVGTSDGKVYKNGTAQSGWASGVVHDLLIIQDCLLIFTSNTTINLVTNLSGFPNLTANWKTGLEQSIYGWKKAILGQDNVIYFGNETKLGSLVGFTSVPPLTATATLNTSCISTSLPNDRVIQTICEQNRYIAISTSKTGNGFGNTVLYFMDRGLLDASRTSFYLSIGVEVPERKVNLMITKNNRIYFFGNDTGTFYTTNTTTYTPVAVIPNRLQGEVYNDSFPTTPNAVAILNNEILFGIGGSFNSAYDVVYGVYSLRESSLVCKHTISAGQYGQSANVSIGAICVVGSGSYHVGWTTNSTYGVDAADTRLGTSYNCWFESPFYETGSAIKPRTFQTVQFNFGNNLAEGQGMKLYFRQSSNASWVLYGTYTYASGTLAMSFSDGTTSSQAGTFNSFNSKMPQTGTTNAQIKVEFTTGSSATYGTNIELQSITLI